MNAYIAGCSKTRFSRLEGPRPWMSLDVMAQAATSAPNDSDLKRSEIDGVFVWLHDDTATSHAGEPICERFTLEKRRPSV